MFAASLGPLFVTVTDQVIGDPASAAETAAETVRSADAVVRTEGDAVLLVRFGSDVVELTEIVAVSVVPAAMAGATDAVIVTTAVDPAGSAGRLHDGVHVTRVTPAGRTGVTVRFTASLGPPFVTVAVYVRVPPAVTGSGVAATAMRTFAEVVTVTLAFIGPLKDGVSNVPLMRSGDDVSDGATSTVTVYAPDQPGATSIGAGSVLVTSVVPAGMACVNETGTTFS
jgi:hypothetical protein